MALLDARKGAEARDLLQPCADQEGNDPGLSIALARIRLAFGDPRRAVRILERAEKAHPQNVDVVLWLARAYGDRAIRAPVFEQPSFAVRVRKSFERAVAIDPENLEARSGLLEYLIRAPKVLGGNADRAREQAREIERRDPLKGARAYGRIAEHEKRWAEADRAYARAMQEFPTSDEPVLWRATLASGQKNWERAFELLETWLTSHPRDPVACYELGRIAALSGQRLDRGEECLRFYTSREPGPDEPTLADAHFQLGNLYRKKKETAQAREQYGEALRLDPGLTEARVALAAVR